MHGFMSYQHFKRARSLRNDRTTHVLGRYVATKLGFELGCYVATEPFFLQRVTFVKNVRAYFYGDLDVNIVVTVFDPNS
ncbi:hypothetical protein YC2023_023498 [Brassica napus]